MYSTAWRWNQASWMLGCRNGGAIAIALLGLQFLVNLQLPHRFRRSQIVKAQSEGRAKAIFLQVCGSSLLFGQIRSRYDGRIHPGKWVRIGWQ